VKPFTRAGPPASDTHDHGKDGNMSTWRIRIEPDEDFDPRDPECHEELIADYDAGRIAAFDVTLERVCAECGAWDVQAVVGGVLLDPNGTGGVGMGVVTEEEFPAAFQGEELGYMEMIVNDLMRA
jgi:hypothetical protein